MEAGALRQVAWPPGQRRGVCWVLAPPSALVCPSSGQRRQTRALGAEILWYSTERTSAPSLAELLKPWEFTDLAC